MLLTAIDPGTDMGWAQFVMGELRACGLGDPPVTKARDQSMVIECPEIVPGRHVNPNDMITLAIKVGRMIERFDALGAITGTVKPTVWKGGPVPKPIMNGRIIKRLSAREADTFAGCGAPYSKLHNVLDAIGIGLWATERI